MAKTRALMPPAFIVGNPQSVVKQTTFRGKRLSATAVFFAAFCGLPNLHRNHWMAVAVPPVKSPTLP
jgi:hypothetical protein